MKLINKLIAAIALTMGVSTASAQNGLSIHAGNTFPIGAFSQGDKASDIALNNISSNYGGAATGFNVGAKVQLSILGDLSAFVEADFLYNGLKKELKKEGNDNSLPSYINMPVIGGVNYTLFEVLGTTFWAEAGVGMNFSKITNSVSLNFSESVLDISKEANYDLTTSLAWKAGIGVTIANKFSLGAHYYGFGASNISGETTSSINMGNITSDFKDSFSQGTLKTSMIVVRLGYHF